MASLKETERPKEEEENEGGIVFVIKIDGKEPRVRLCFQYGDRVAVSTEGNDVRSCKTVNPHTLTLAVCASRFLPCLGEQAGWVVVPRDQQYFIFIIPSHQLDLSSPWSYTSRTP